jgi:hypothetical protein
MNIENLGDKNRSDLIEIIHTQNFNLSKSAKKVESLHQGNIMLQAQLEDSLKHSK